MKSVEVLCSRYLNCHKISNFPWALALCACRGLSLSFPTVASAGSNKKLISAAQLTPLVRFQVLDRKWNSFTVWLAAHTAQKIRPSANTSFHIVGCQDPLSFGAWSAAFMVTCLDWCATFTDRRKCARTTLPGSISQRSRPYGSTNRRSNSVTAIRPSCNAHSTVFFFYSILFTRRILNYTNSYMNVL